LNGLIGTPTLQFQNFDERDCMVVEDGVDVSARGSDLHGREWLLLLLHTLVFVSFERARLCLSICITAIVFRNLLTSLVHLRHPLPYILRHWRRMMRFIILAICLFISANVGL
jgi:hypothetical protein